MVLLVGTKSSAQLYRGADRAGRYRGSRPGDWVPSAAAPSIAATTGSGYAGSTFTVTNGGIGKWQDGTTDIAGATDPTIFIPASREGVALSWLRSDGIRSNVIDLWIPSDDAGLLIWVDPSSFLTVNGSNVTGIRDRVLSARSFTQTNGADQPVVGPTQLNGLDVIRFLEKKLDGNFGNPLVGKPWTVIALLAPNVQQGADSHYFGGNADSAGRTLQLGWRNNTTITIAYYANDANFTVPGFAGREFALHTSQQSTTQRQFWLNTVSRGVNANTTYLTRDTDNLFLGSAVRASNRADNVDLAHLVATASIDAATVAKHEGYQAWRYNQVGTLRADHPYKSAPPRN